MRTFTFISFNVVIIWLLTIPYFQVNGQEERVLGEPLLFGEERSLLEEEGESLSESSPSPNFKASVLAPQGPLIYMVATGPGPCWSGPGCGGGFSVPENCPVGYQETKYGQFCADCGDYSCDKSQTWVDTAFHTVYTWGCTPDYKYMALSVRVCQRIEGVIYKVATGPGPCWSSGCGGGFGIPEQCPKGYEDLAYGELCADCGNYSCDKNQSWIDTAFHTVYTWGCQPEYKYMALTVRACRPA